MAPKNKAKGDNATAVDESIVAECKRLQDLAYEGVREHMHDYAGFSLVHRASSYVCCVCRCCQRLAGCAPRKSSPAKVSDLCIFARRAVAPDVTIECCCAVLTKADGKDIVKKSSVRKGRCGALRWQIMLPGQAHQSCQC